MPDPAKTPSVISLSPRAPLLWVLAVMLILGLGAGSPPGDDEAEYEKAARTILCDCGCHPQSVHQCACGRAAEMRGEIMAQIRQGLTGEEVIEAYVAGKGEQVRIAPKARGFNLVAWLGPSLLFLLATLGLALVLKRWRSSAPAPAPRASLDPDDPYLVRLRKDLEKHP